MKVQKIDTTTNQRKVGLVELADLASEVTSNYLLRAGNDFAGFSALPLATSDLLLVEDASNSNAKGKVTIQSILDLSSGGSEIDNTGDTFFVSPNYTAVGIYYDDLTDAIDDADANTNIIVFAGTYTGNYTVDVGCTIHFMVGAILSPSTTTSPALTITGSCRITGNLVIDYIPSGGAYAVDAPGVVSILEADSICPSLGLNALRMTSPSTAMNIISVKQIGCINISSSGSTRIICKQIDNITYSGENECYINAQLITGIIDVSAGELFLKSDIFLEGTINVATVTGGTLVMSGRIPSYANGTTNTTGVGYPLKVTGAGLLILKDLQCKNSLGGNLWLSGGEARLQDVAFESGSAGGGATACIDSIPPGSGVVRYIGNTTLKAGGGLIGTELITANRVIDVNVAV